MEEIMKDLEAAFKATSAIPVTGDAVDALAVVRANLRKVYAEITNMKTEKNDTDGKMNEMDTQEE